MQDDTQTNEVAFMLGRVHGDVKHILDELKDNRGQFKSLEKRMDKVEQFNVRVITAAAILMPLISIAINFAVAYFI